jgi:hypothetical protein
MLKRKLDGFYRAIEDARREIGNSPVQIADAILDDAFPNAWAAARQDGCDDMLRRGVIEAIRRYVVNPPASDPRQVHANDIAPDLMPLVAPLARRAYLVPSPQGSEMDEEMRTLGFYVPVAELVRDPDALRAARDFLAVKTGHLTREVERLTALIDRLEARGDV